METWNLPSHDALAQILPKRQSLQTREKTRCRIAAQEEHKHNINHTYKVFHPHKRPPLHGVEEGPRMAELSDLQTKEVENYRSAMNRMAEDIIALRTKVELLAAENSKLRTDQTLHQNLVQNLLDYTDNGVMTNTQIADRIATLKFKQTCETSNETLQSDRIQQLQNELIKKNDMEKEMMKLQRVHQQQQTVLQRQHRHLTKMATLEVTVKQQEKMKMERSPDHSLKETNRQRGDKKLQNKVQRDESDHKRREVESALAAENSRLRKELDRICQKAPVIIEQTAQTKETPSAQERHCLINKLENAEARIKMLESKLEENAGIWGRQKQELLIKLSEQRHGFVRTSTAILLNIPSVNE